jgi:alkylation response protein AidB-like acyl-CoA dehydrogenase
MSSDLDLVCSAEEEQLRASVAKLLADRVDPTAALTRAEGDDLYDHGLWRSLAQVGVAGLLVPEALDGQGATARELGVMAEELGRVAAPVPFLGSAVLATVALRSVDEARAAEWLRRIANGTPAVLAVPWTTSFDAPCRASVRTTDDGLTGSVAAVLDAVPAEILLVPAVHEDDVALFAVDAVDAVDAVHRTATRGLDLTRGWATIELDGASGTLLARGPDAASAMRAALLHGAAMVAADQVGVAEHCLDSTVAYVSDRYQFGRPVGSFQALKHRLADVWVGVVGARAAARAAASALANGAEDAAVTVAVAKAHCSTVAVLAAEEAVQLHGGIGMTWEHPTHVFLKRAKVDELLFGAPGRHRAALAALVGLPAA